MCPIVAQWTPNNFVESARLKKQTEQEREEENHERHQFFVASMQTFDTRNDESHRKKLNYYQTNETHTYTG